MDIGRPVLPEELISHIFCYLEPDVFKAESLKEQVLRQTTFISACLASKSFYRIVRPIYYRTSDLSCGNEPDSARLDGPFLAILGSRDTASLVRRLQLPVSSQGRGEDCTFVPPHASDFERIKFLRRLAETASLREDTRRALMESIKGLRAGAICGAILFACSNLQVLHLRTKGSKETLPTALLDLAGRSSDCPFRCLHELDIEHKPDPHFLELHKIPHLFSLPGLRIFRAYNVAFSHRSEVEPPSMGRVAVEQIELHNSWIHRTGIEILFQMCPQLRHLTIIWEMEGIRPLFQRLDAIGDVLRRHAASLETLTLQMDDLGSAYLDRLMAPSLGSLRDLGALSSLTISKWLLTGGIPDEREPDHVPFDELLPYSLRELHVLEELGSDLDYTVAWVDPLMSDDRYHDLSVISIRGIHRPHTWPWLTTVQFEASSVGWKAGWIGEGEFEFRKVS